MQKFFNDSCMPRRYNIKRFRRQLKYFVLEFIYLRKVLLPVMRTTSIGSAVVDGRQIISGFAGLPCTIPLGGLSLIQTAYAIYPGNIVKPPT